MVLVIIEVMAWLTTGILAVLWVRNPTGNYEPWTVLCGVVAAGAEGYRRFRGRSKELPNQLSKPEELIRWIQEHGTEKPLSQVLPRALQLALLIRDPDLEHWLRMELYGYTQEGGMAEQDTVPEYREITGRYMDEYNRMLQIQDPRFDFVNGYRFRLGVRQLEEIAGKSEMQNIRDEDFVELLRQELQVNVHRFCFSPTEVVGVLDRVRNRLMERINRIELKSGGIPKDNLTN